MKTDLEFLAEHRRIWSAKPRLRESYRRYHDMLLADCPRDGVVLELGCGIGTLTERARELGFARWVSSDILATESADLRCDATALPLASASLDRIVFVDVLHHLSAPTRFFREAARVLKPGGAVLAVEPWVTPLSYPIYRWVHHEGCDLSRDVEAPFSAAGSKPAYEGDNGIPSLLCRRVGAPRWSELGFLPPAVRTFNDFGYLTTRGFRGGRDAPSIVFAAARSVDVVFGPCSSVFGLRALIKWGRRA
jgi:SAM-dependent methyltransferase